MLTHCILIRLPHTINWKSPISILGSSGCERKMAKLFANSGDPDQTPRSAASDLGLHCLPSTLLGVSRLKWVKWNGYTSGEAGSVRVPEWLSLPTSNQEVPRSNPARDPNDLITVWRFIAQSFSLIGYKKKPQIIIIPGRQRCQTYFVSLLERSTVKGKNLHPLGENPFHLSRTRCFPL